MTEIVNRARIALRKERGTWAVLLAIVVLALVLRMGWPTLAEFKRDEAKEVRGALAIVYEGALPVVGVGSSIGVANLPLTRYLIAIPLLLWRDPVAAVLWVGLLNALAVPACYLLGRAYFSRAAGLVAAFLFATCPWAVLYGRKLWPRTLPLIALAFIAALLATFVRRRPWALTVALVGLAALLGLQLEGIAFIPLLLILMLLYWKQVAWRPLLLGALLCILAVSPYLIHDALQGWRNAHGFVQYLRGERHFSWDALRYAFLLTGSTGIEGMAGGLYPQYRAGLPNLWGLNRLMMGLLALALPYGLFQVIRGPKERRRSILVLLLWFAIPVALQSRPSAVVQPHYFVLLYPVQFLLIAIVLVDVVQRFPLAKLRLAGRQLPVSALALVAVLLLWGGWQTAVVGRLFLFMDQHPITGGYGIPLQYPRQAAREALRLAGDSEIVVLSDGMDPLFDETPAVFEALLFGHPHRFADGRWALPVPDDSTAVYVVGPVDEQGGLELGPGLRRLEMMQFVQAGPVVPLPGGWSYRIFYRNGPDREDVLAGMLRFPEAIAFANGIAFMGYEMEEQVSPGETLEVWIAWWVRALPPGADYHFFAHLLDEEGGLRGQHDASGFPTYSWQVGDVVLSRFVIAIPTDLPPERYQVRAGLYTYPDVVNVPVLDAAGNPTGDGVTLGEVEVGR